MPMVATAAPFSTNEPRVNHPRRPDLNAFVDHAVYDTRSLVAEVKGNPQVAARYAELFKMSPAQVTGYLGTLHRERLATTQEFTVYSAPENGPIRHHQEVLKKGTPVFADTEGRPKLIVKCGNPIGMPPPPLALATILPPTTTETVENDLPGPRDADADTLDDLTSIPPIVPEIGPVIEAGPEDAVALTIPQGLAAHSILPYLGLAPLLAPVFGSNGHGGNIVIFPTPEPAPFAVLGLSAVALLRRRRKA